MARHTPELGCDVWRPAAGRGGLCTNLAVRPFRAVCEHGHVMEGRACEVCLNSEHLGCLTCWQGTGKHRCTVRFGESTLPLEPVS